MKRIPALLLTAALALSLALPAAAAAENTQEEQLSQITQSVKETLGLDTAQYDSFTGEPYDSPLYRQWDLTWEGDGETLSIEVLEDGTVTALRLRREEPSDPGLPGYPQGDRAAARETAEEFLAQVLTPGLESARLEEETGDERLGQDQYSFYGTILLNGLPSPLSCSVTVDGESGQVVRFSRDMAQSFVGGVPSAVPAVEQDAAAQALEGSLSLELEYVLPEEGGDRAVLRYVPKDFDEYYVDAQTGELVNLSQLERELSYGASGGSTSNDAASPESGLSQAEQEGIQKLEGVLPKEELDQKLRSVAAYGLEGNTLSSAAYRLVEREGQEDQVLCTLTYRRALEEGSASRTFTVDARTGAVEDLWSSLPWEEGQAPALAAGEARQTAEDFLQEQFPQAAPRLALYGQGEEEPEWGRYSFTFARQENGIFFPEHAFTVDVYAGDGSVCGLSYVYREGITFETPEGIVTQEAALSAWMDTYTVELGYLPVPRALDESDPEDAALMAALGLGAWDTLKLGYALGREGYLYGVDARTGVPVEREAAGTFGGYTDLSGHWAQEAAQALARYGVGYDTSSFQPDKALTQWDLVCLLASVEGYFLDPEGASDQERNMAYEAAYRLGALERGERQDGSLLTRSDAVKLLLNAQGLQSAARLSGIYTCSYPDRDSIPAQDLGYAALAQGIGMVQGTWAGDRTATRGEAAVMLHRLLSW